jgi:hypothetical protein
VGGQGRRAAHGRRRRFSEAARRRRDLDGGVGAAANGGVVAMTSDITVNWRMRSALAALIAIAALVVAARGGSSGPAATSAAPTPSRSAPQWSYVVIGDSALCGPDDSTVADTQARLIKRDVGAGVPPRSRLGRGHVAPRGSRREPEAVSGLARGLPSARDAPCHRRHDRASGPRRQDRPRDELPRPSEDAVARSGSQGQADPRVSGTNHAVIVLRDGWPARLTASDRHARLRQKGAGRRA